MWHLDCHLENIIIIIIIIVIIILIIIIIIIASRRKYRIKYEINTVLIQIL